MQKDFKENIMFVGTSHISSKSKQELIDAVNSFNPDVIALELDRGRYQSLIEEMNNINQTKKKSKPAIKELGLKSYLFYAIAGFLQKRLAKVVNTDPGIEMREAIKICSEKKIPIILIDQNINTTMKKLSKCLNFGFIIAIFKDFFKGLFVRTKKMKKFKLNDIPDDETLDFLMNEFRDSYPCLYNVLVEERNEIMIHNIVKFVKNNPDKKIIVVIGLGHKKGMIEILNKM